MQTLDLTKFNNPSNWQVVHESSDNLYYIRSDKGHYLQGAFTERKLAENKLRAYLEQALIATNKRHNKES